jgi:hypothetical protein
MHTYNIKPQQIETIEASRYDAKWKPRASIYIANTENEAINNLQNGSSDVKVFTDGSGMDGKIGAGAVLY